MLEDIAIITGGQVITEEKGMKLEAVELEMLGQARRVVATKEKPLSSAGKVKKPTSINGSPNSKIKLQPRLRDLIKKTCGTAGQINRWRGSH